MNAANNVNGVGNCHAEELLTLKHADLTEVQVAVTQKIVQELKDFDNLYYEICNEPYANRRVPMEWQQRIVDAIVDAEKDFPQQHLISLNIANGRPESKIRIRPFRSSTSTTARRRTSWTMNYGLNKLIGENETGFRGHDDVLYRTEGWDFLLAGGGLYNNLDYSFSPPIPPARSPASLARRRQPALRAARHSQVVFRRARFRSHAARQLVLKPA